MRKPKEFKVMCVCGKKYTEEKLHRAFVNAMLAKIMNHEDRIKRLETKLP